MITDLASYVVGLALIMAAIGALFLPIISVVTLTHRLLIGRNSLPRWGLMLLLTLAWSGVAIWSLQILVVEFRIADKSQPAVGSDIVGLLFLALVLFPLWWFLLCPSFPALLTVVIMHPRFGKASANLEASCQRLWNYRHRNWVLVASFFLAAAILRAALYGFTGI